MDFAGTRYGRWVGHAVRMRGSTCLLLCALFAISPIARALGVNEIRYWSLGEVTRVVVQFDGEFQYKWARLDNPPRVFFDLPGAVLRVDPGQTPGKVRSIDVKDAVLQRIRYAENSPMNARVVLDLAADCEVKASQLANPARLIIELRSKDAPRAPIEVSRTGGVGGGRTDTETVASAGDEFAPTETAESRPAPGVSPVATQPVREISKQNSAATALGEAGETERKPIPPTVSSPARPAVSVEARKAATPPPSQVTNETAGVPVEKPVEVAIAKPAARTATGQQSLVRALGLKAGRIVIDPGHGGKDQGTSAGEDLHEKDLVLDIAKRLRDLIATKVGAEVVLTREDDTFISLEERTAIANRHRADLFVSLHANSSPFKLASGSETFYLNFTSSREAMDIAARENASSTKSIADLQDIVKKIALKDKRDESQDLAAKVQGALYKAQRREGIAKKNRGVKAAPFIVLIGADMPSILVEIGFLSNAKERSALRTAEYRQALAEGLFQGLQSYIASLSHFESRERAAREE